MRRRSMHGRPAGSGPGLSMEDAQAARKAVHGSGRVVAPTLSTAGEDVVQDRCHVNQALPTAEQLSTQQHRHEQNSPQAPSAARPERALVDRSRGKRPKLNQAPAMGVATAPPMWQGSALKLAERAVASTIEYVSSVGCVRRVTALVNVNHAPSARHVAAVDVWRTCPRVH